MMDGHFDEKDTAGSIATGNETAVTPPLTIQSEKTPIQSKQHPLPAPSQHITRLSVIQKTGKRAV